MSGTATRPPDDRTLAWWSLALLPVSFVAAFVVGEGLASLFGYRASSGSSPPAWVALGAAVPALLVFSVPAVLAVHFGRRALLSGDRRGRAPIVVAVVVTGLFVAQNLLGLLVG